MIAALDVLTLLLPDQKAVRLDTVAAVGARVGQILVLPPVVEVPAEGVDFEFDWGAALPGTDRAELDPVTVEVQAARVPDFAGYSLGELASGPGNELTVSVPAGRRIRALKLTGLKADGITFRSVGDLKVNGYRIAVSQPAPGGGWTPVVAVPAVAGSGPIPPMLTGATFDSAVLRMPDLAGPLRIAVVKGATPAEFEIRPLTVQRVYGWAAPTPVDLTLTGPDGATLWSFPGPLPEGTEQRQDVTVALAAAVEQLRAAGGPVAGSVKLTSKYPCQVRFRLTPVAGELIRELSGTTTVELSGEPVALPVDSPLPLAAPASVLADVRVTYNGCRLADVSDPMPAPGAQHGAVVRQDRVLRVLPPLALRGEQISRIGLVGYCPQRTELLVRLVAATPIPSGTAADALGEPGTVTVDPSTAVGVIWIDLPQPVRVEEAAAIEVSAGTGTLYWVADPDPLVRIVVLDPDPAARPIRLGGHTLLTVDQPTITAVRVGLPAEAYLAGAPVLASALFCTVEITDARLSYPRGT
ncbi:hypothetical protein [Mycolicibacterium neworleansense]|uniref:Uncharacterized protein n=1 Tax=Mycolicibacterium neworleansense TaxID=146018 RepID=A0A0H5RL22_9MYCO|nr:hypothetical protein [Mycolicibacterium neworleansense]MCV7363854.1 hypothetical protein [Mycolicibacterium neworleansense]CRZ14805.1 hypothetical protein BN2156_01661 [Mycolicibacterium neworleansense]